VVPAGAALGVAVYVISRKRRLLQESGSFITAAAGLSVHLRRWSQGIEFAVLGAYVAALAAGWRSMPEAAGATPSALATGAVVIAPFIVALIGVWGILHFAERAVRGAGPTLAQRLSFKVRHNILTLCIPVAVILAIYDGLALLPRDLKAPFERPWAAMTLTALMILGGYTIAPLVIVRIWKTSRLPDCPLRERLTLLCKRIGVGFRDIRVWETPGHFFANAAVMGVAGFVRYIIVSRSLIEVMPEEEVEAVFAHELGHARRHHMVFYLVLAANFMLLAHIFESITGTAIEEEATYLVIWTVLFAVYWGGVFGYVSRLFEREADLFGAEASPDFGTFAIALARIAHINGVSPDARSWRHGSIRSRVEFLSAAARVPQVRRRFLIRLNFVKVFLVTNGLLAAAAAAVLQAIRMG
jgi:STE24 endopeptidase